MRCNRVSSHIEMIVTLCKQLTNDFILLGSKFDEGERRDWNVATEQNNSFVEAVEEPC